MLKNLNDYLSLIVEVLLLIFGTRFLIGSVFPSDDSKVDRKSFRYIFTQFRDYTDNTDD